MELDKLTEASILLNYYKNLLTNKQKDYLVDHLEDDMSLSEIAKNYGVSRQAVYDNIKRGLKTLYEYEEKIGFYSKEMELEGELKRLKKDLTVENVDKILEKLF